MVGPSPAPFDVNYPVPSPLCLDEIRATIEAFVQGARRALAAGFKVAEIHAAHGYLLHTFLSPLANIRSDLYGGSLHNRMRLVLEVVEGVRRVWPENLPLWVRISATDWAQNGWDLEQSLVLAQALRDRGVDLIDCSSGGLVPRVRIPAGPGYQVAFAEQIRRETGLATGAVGLITDPRQADDILRQGQADMVLLGREFLRNPYWPLQAARELDWDLPWPVQYRRAKSY